MRTEIYVKAYRSGRKELVKEPKGATRYYADWRSVLTVGLWKLITDRKPEEIPKPPSQVELKLWRYCLLDSNLINPNTVKHDVDGFLTDEALSEVANTRPAFIAFNLVRPLWVNSGISEAEVTRIKREYQAIWFGGAKAMPALHPLLEEALVGMTLADKWQVPLYRDIDQIPQRSMAALRVIAATYTDLMEMERQNVSLRERAAQEAGLRPGPRSQAN